MIELPRAVWELKGSPGVVIIYFMNWTPTRSMGIEGAILQYAIIRPMVLNSHAQYGNWRFILITPYIYISINWTPTRSMGIEGILV